MGGRDGGMEEEEEEEEGVEHCNADRGSFICLLDLTSRSLLETRLLTSISPHHLCLFFFVPFRLLSILPTSYFLLLLPQHFPRNFSCHAPSTFYHIMLHLPCLSVTTTFCLLSSPARPAFLPLQQLSLLTLQIIYSAHTSTISYTSAPMEISTAFSLCALLDTDFN